MTAEDSAEGERARKELAEVADREQRWSNDLLGIELGYRYDGSPLIVPEEGEAPDPDQFSYRPSAWPGTRIPHVWLSDGTASEDTALQDGARTRVPSSGRTCCWSVPTCTSPGAATVPRPTRIR